MSTGKELGIVARACHPSNGGKHKIEGSQNRLAWAKSQTLSPE
jgi:hypothetical protein